MSWLKPHPLKVHPTAPFEVACPCVQTDRRRQHQTQIHTEAHTKWSDFSLLLPVPRPLDIYYISMYNLHLYHRRICIISAYSHVTEQIKEAYLLAFVLCTTLAHNLASNFERLTWLDCCFSIPTDFGLP